METKNFNLKNLSMIVFLILIPLVNYGQNEKSVIDKFLTRLPSIKEKGKEKIQKLKMTAIYVNMDKLGNITGRIMVTGDYTRGADDGKVSWNNVYIHNSQGDGENFDEGKKQEYMENFIYRPSREMLKESSFSGFPKNVENIYARNLIWDMMAIEDFAWNYTDSLHLNHTFILPKTGYNFEMAGIGDYSQNSIQLSWTGISGIGNELCANIEYRALYNKMDINMEQIKSKGTELYWGNTRISLKTGLIVFAEMYSNTCQEAEVSGFRDKFVIKTVREIKVERIK